MLKLPNDIIDIIPNFFDQNDLVLIYSVMRVCKKWLAHIHNHFDYSLRQRLPLLYNCVHNYEEEALRLMIAPSDNFRIIRWIIMNNNINLLNAALCCDKNIDVIDTDIHYNDCYEFEKKRYTLIMISDIPYQKFLWKTPSELVINKPEMKKIIEAYNDEYGLSGFINNENKRRNYLYRSIDDTNKN